MNQPQAISALVKKWFSRGNRVFDKLFILLYFAARRILNIPLKYLFQKDANFPKLFLFPVQIREPQFRAACRRFHPEDLLICDQLVFKHYFDLPEGSVFVDVGANIGLWSLYVAGQSKTTVYAIEPVPSNVEQLRKNIALNQYGNIHVIPMALWNKPQKDLPLFLGDNLAMSSAKQPFSQQVTVPADTLDNLVETYRIPNITLLKLDVEGAEKEVLEGSVKTLHSMRPNIIFEAWNQDILQELTAFLSPFGYSFSQMDQTNYFAKQSFQPSGIVSSGVS